MGKEEKRAQRSFSLLDEVILRLDRILEKLISLEEKLSLGNLKRLGQLLR